MDVEVGDEFHAGELAQGAFAAEKPLFGACGSRGLHPCDVMAVGRPEGSRCAACCNTTDSAAPACPRPVSVTTQWQPNSAGVTDAPRHAGRPVRRAAATHHRDSSSAARPKQSSYASASPNSMSSARRGQRVLLSSRRYTTTLWDTRRPDSTDSGSCRLKPFGELRQGEFRGHKLRPDRPKLLDLQLGDHGEERPAGIRQDAESVKEIRCGSAPQMSGDLLEKCDQFVASSVFGLEYSRTTSI